MIVWQCCGYDAPILFLFHLRSVFCMREYTETLEYRVAQSAFIPKNPEISEANRTGGGLRWGRSWKWGGGGANSSCKFLILYYRID